MKNYNENIFTKIVNKEVSADIVFETPFALIIKDKFPQTKIHWLVLPKNNYVDLEHFLTNATQEEICGFMYAVRWALQQLPYAKVNFNVGSGSGQEIFHMHAHIMCNEDIVK